MNELSITAAAAERPEAIGLIHVSADTATGEDRDKAYSFAELAEQAASARLVTQAIHIQATQGGIATVVASRTPETAALLYAALERHIPLVLIHPRATAEERAHIDALCAGLDAAAHPGLAAVLFTSGSSGRPKGVLLGREAFIASARASAAHLGWHDDDRWLCCLPLGHIGGLSILTRTLMARRTTVLMDEGSFAPAAVAAAIARHRVTLLSLVPTMLSGLLECGWQPPAHVRAVLVGGAAAADPLLEAAYQRGVPVLVTYGMTETCSQICTQTPGTPPRPGRVGKPLAGAEVRVQDGRIRVRGPMLFRGYLGAGSTPEKDPGNNPKDDDGWLVTGDSGVMDEHGELHVLGRADDMIITGGENVHPAEVEAVLCAHPAIAAACVFPVSDAAFGQIVAAALVYREAPPPDAALAAFLAERLASYKRPRRICALPRLPLGPTGKVDRVLVAAQTAGMLRPFSYRA